MCILTDTSLYNEYMGQMGAKVYIPAFPADIPVLPGVNGYDLTVGPEYSILPRDKILSPHERLDLPKHRIPEEGLVLEPGYTYLLHTKEVVELDRNTVGQVGIRSTFARLGVWLPPTYVDAGFKGQLTLEVSTTGTRVRIREGDKLVHLILWRACSPSSGYRSVYQGQKGVQEHIPHDEINVPNPCEIMGNCLGS